MTVCLKTDPDREPGTIIAEQDGKVVVFWLWARRQWIYVMEELEVIV